eukprot:s2160_g11.t1
MAQTLQSLLWKAGRIWRYLSQCPAIAEPCVGIGGLRTWIQSSGVPYHATVCSDFDSDIGHFYESLKKNGEEGLEKIQCGPKKGDVMDMSSESLESCEIFLSGTPCQPYAGNGKGLGFLDDRSLVLEKCIEQITEFARRGTLILFLLENSQKLAEHPEFWQLMNYLVCSCPFFKVEIRMHDLQSLVPHSRPRLWVRGLRIDCLPDPTRDLPPPMNMSDFGFSKLSLETFLEPEEPNLDPTRLTNTMQSNLTVYKKMAQEAMQKPDFSASIMCCELDRNPLKNYGGAVAFDCVPSFRTQGPQIFLVSLADLEKPWSEQRLHRFLSVRERFALQGHPHAMASHFRNKSASMKASGNAFNVLAMAVMMAPLLEAAASEGVLQRGKVKHLDADELAALIPAEGPLPCAYHKVSSSHKDGQKKRKRVA